MIISFNWLGFAWLMIGGVIGMGVNLLLGHPPRQPHMITMGFIMFICDFSYRFLSPDGSKLATFFKSSNGGQAIIFPCWLLGIFLCILGALTI